MIRSHLRAGIALACAFGLSACGGSDGDVYLSGQAYGISKPGLVLTNNGGSDLAVDTSGTFTFKDPVERDSRYVIEVKSVPPNVEKKEDCVVSNGTNRAVYNVVNIRVICTIRKRALGGTIVGLGSDSTDLELVNGSDRKVIPAGATSFAMDPVSEESPYGITILKQPSNRTCTVENGTGTMPSSDLNSVVVRCTP